MKINLKRFHCSNLRIKGWFYGFMLYSITAHAQIPTPGEVQSIPIIIRGAIIHVGNGIVYSNGQISFDKGKIVSVDSTDKESLFMNPIIINAKGKHIYPGLIALNTSIGLNEIDAVRSTRDYNEVGENNARVRSIIAYNTDSKVTPTIRSNGILIAQITPQGGSISGNSAVVQLDAWNWEDAAIKSDDALHLNWPRISVQNNRGSESGEADKSRADEELKALELIFSNAQNYCSSKPQTINLNLEAFRKVFTREKKVFVHTEGAREMINAVEFLRPYGITPVIVGGDESFLIAGFLRKNQIAVVLLRTHTLPSLPEDDVDLPYKLPKILLDSGVLYCITDVGAWQQRNLPFQAGTSVGFGLTPEQALMSITKNSSEILGISKNYGTLEAGKSATLLICDGDILDMKTSKVSRAWIDGRETDLDNSQKQLDRKFRKKYFGE